jgi:hypothetical protein
MGYATLRAAGLCKFGTRGKHCGSQGRSDQTRHVLEKLGGGSSPAKPVSNAGFPANRENYREFFKIGHPKRLLVRENPRAAATSGIDSLRKITGKIITGVCGRPPPGRDFQRQ